jgi:IstB-like ATP binding protein
MTTKPRRGLTEQAADAAVDQACRMLHLPTLRAQFPDLADAAAREQMSYRGFLAEMLMAECDDRARRRSERQIKAAGFPREKSLRAFDFDANPAIDPAVVNTLATCDWVRKGLPLCLHRRLRHRKVPPPDRPGNRGRHGRLPRPGPGRSRDPGVRPLVGAGARRDRDQRRRDD